MVIDWASNITTYHTNLHHMIWARVQTQMNTSTPHWSLESHLLRTNMESLEAFTTLTRSTLEKYS